LECTRSLGSQDIAQAVSSSCKIAAAGVVEGADRRPISFGDIIKEGVQIGIDIFADGGAALPEMQRARHWDRHLRRDARMRLQQLEMLQHRMTGKADFAVDLERVRLGLHAVKLDAVIRQVKDHAVKAAKEIKNATRCGETRRRWRVSARSPPAF
jgi:hypothetical protein